MRLIIATKRECSATDSCANIAVVWYPLMCAAERFRMKRAISSIESQFYAFGFQPTAHNCGPLGDESAILRLRLSAGAQLRAASGQSKTRRAPTYFGPQ